MRLIALSYPSSCSATVVVGYALYEAMTACPVMLGSDQYGSDSGTAGAVVGQVQMLSASVIIEKTTECSQYFEDCI